MPDFPLVEPSGVESICPQHLIMVSDHRLGVEGLPVLVDNSVDLVILGLVSDGWLRVVGNLSIVLLDSVSDSGKLGRWLTLCLS